MRTLFILILLIAGSLAAAWLGGETWLAREAARRIEADPRIESAAVTPLREIDRVGLHLAEVGVETPQGTAQLPALDLWAAPTSPNEFHATLPPQMTVPLGGQPRQVAAQNAVLTLRVSPGNDMAISRAAAASGAVTVDGAALLTALDLDARLAPMGADAPRAARASYVLSGRAEGLTPGGVIAMPPAIAGAGAMSAEGTGRVYLTAPLKPQQAEPPQVVGLASDGVTLQLGDRTARLTGHLAADDEGRAQGAVFVYTADPRGWLDLAAAAGAIPQGAVALAGTALDAAAALQPDLPPGTPVPAEPAKGELRIPLIFRDGQSFMGPIPLGTAPLLPRLP